MNTNICTSFSTCHYVWNAVKDTKHVHQCDEKMFVSNFYKYRDEKGLYTIQNVVKWRDENFPCISLWLSVFFVNTFISFPSRKVAEKTIDIHLTVYSGTCLPYFAIPTLHRKRLNKKVKDVSEKFKELISVCKKHAVDCVSVNDIGSTQNVTYFLPRNIWESEEFVFFLKNNAHIRDYDNQEKREYILCIDLEAMVACKNDTDVCTMICELMYKKCSQDRFIFANQTLTKIARDWYFQMYGRIPGSSYNRSTEYALQDFSPIASKALNERKNVANDQYPYPLYSIHNKIEEFSGDLCVGEYYIETLKIQEGQVVIPAGFYGRNLIDYLLENRWLKNQDIKYQIVADASISPHTLRNYVCCLLKMFDDETTDRILHAFVESFECDTEEEKAYFETRDLLSLHLLYQESRANRIMYVNEVGGSYIVEFCTKRKKMYNSNSFVRHWNSQSIVDAIESGIEYKNERKGYDASDYLFERGDGKFVYGGAGCGKTTDLVSSVLEATNPIVMSFTNKSVENLKRLLPPSYASCVCTLSKFFSNPVEQKIQLLQGMHVFVDEFSMVPKSMMNSLYTSFKRYGTQINFYGDSNQCEPVETDGIVYDYAISPAMFDMCSTYVLKGYIADSARYDRKTFDFLNKFLLVGRIEQKMSPHVLSYVNICYHNKTRHEVNEKCSQRFVRKKKHVYIDFSSDDGIHSYPIAVGTPVICKKSIPRKEIFNSQRFEVKGITETHVKIDFDNATFPIASFGLFFDPGFCVTVYKYQGGSIDTHYNIYDSEYMDKKQLYTALSRTTKFEFLHIQNVASEYLESACKEHVTLEPRHTQTQYKKFCAQLIQDNQMYYKDECGDWKTIEYV